MKFYFAPMEGINGYVYRNVHKKFFPGVDKYFMPFVVANQTYRFKTKEKKDIAPENNREIAVVPQIMANKAEEFIWAAEELKKLGYEEINLNLGCPMATVVNKKKGSGFLAYPEELDAFLDHVFEKLEEQKMKLSIKTRLGRDSVEEADRLIEIYNRYPLSELIIHPRIQKDFYKKEPHLDVFERIAKQSVHPVCYNGNLFCKEDFYRFQEQFPDIDAVMFGRGLVANPGLVREIKEQRALSAQELQTFQNAVYEAYGSTTLGETNTLFKMKELWAYMGQMFGDSDRLVRKIRKARNRSEYETAVRNLFASCELNGTYRG